MDVIGDITKKLSGFVGSSKASPEELLLELYSSERDLFFTLGSLSPDAFESPVRELLRLVRLVRAAAQLGYDFKANNGHKQLVVLNAKDQFSVNLVPDLARQYSDLLVELSGAVKAESGGKDYSGKEISSAEFSFLYNPINIEIDRTDEESRKKAEPIILRLDQEDIDDLKVKPRSVFDELIEYARPTVYNPSVVFSGLRKTGPLKQGKAFCAVPELAHETHPGMVFVVFADHENMVFDWGWIKADSERPNYPEQWTERFDRPLPGGVYGKLLGVKDIKYVGFDQPIVAYSKRGDCIFFFREDKPSYTHRVNDDLTLLLDLNSPDINGCKLKNIDRILRQIFSSRMPVKELGIEIKVVGSGVQRTFSITLPLTHALFSSFESYPRDLNIYNKVVRDVHLTFNEPNAQLNGEAIVVEPNQDMRQWLALNRYEDCLI